MSAQHHSQERRYADTHFSFAQEASKTPVGELSFTIETSPTQNPCRYVGQGKHFYSILNVCSLFFQLNLMSTPTAPISLRQNIGGQVIT